MKGELLLFGSNFYNQRQTSKLKTISIVNRVEDDASRTMLFSLFESHHSRIDQRSTYGGRRVQNSAKNTARSTKAAPSFK
mmetsp:Transcript_21431/g.50751  ORF Transcript_21431/g.50751 Transcript_21431/m.50751 type:complete len:80 (+) Transcript_21431:537-776(+)